VGNATKSDEVKTGRAIWLDTNHRRKIVTLSKGNQCVCADVKRVFEIMEKQPKYGRKTMAEWDRFTGRNMS
jgi:hypothetical protein